MLDQVLLNRTVNARDAIPGGSRLNFSMRRPELDAAAAAFQEGRPEAWSI